MIEENLKIIIAGSRSFDDYPFLVHNCDLIINRLNTNNSPIEIVSGNAVGADQFGEMYAKERGYKLTIFKPDWTTHNQYAGLVRNKQMGDYANSLIAFWDIKSKGTQHMIEYASLRRLSVDVVDFTKSPVYIVNKLEKEYQLKIKNAISLLVFRYPGAFDYNILDSIRLKIESGFNRDEVVLKLTEICDYSIKNNVSLDASYEIILTKKIFYED